MCLILVAEFVGMCYRGNKQKTVEFTQGLGIRLCPLGSLELECVNGGETLPVFGCEPYPASGLLLFYHL